MLIELLPIEECAMVRRPMWLHLLHPLFDLHSRIATARRRSELAI
jgi:hypothetical protein